MKGAFLVKYGDAASAFEIRETAQPVATDDQVLIKVEAFGLNFADVMARMGLYKAIPPLPTILGYDIVGIVAGCGSNVKHLKVGDRVTALTQFGGYAEYVTAEKEVANKIPTSMKPGVAVALATQYCTAYFLSQQMANIQPGDRVLIHAAAGGVGTALTQMAIHRKCIVFGTCSSQSKMDYLKSMGIQYPINYLEHDFEDVIRGIIGNAGLDAVFDPVGGKSVKKDFRLLAPGGRVITFGVSSMNKAKNIFGKIKVLLQFGIYHPIQFLSQSKGMIGVNMLTIAREKPEKIGQTMRNVIQWAEEDIIRPHVGAKYSIDQLAEAHEFLASRKSMGKIVVTW